MPNLFENIEGDEDRPGSTSTTPVGKDPKRVRASSDALPEQIEAEQQIQSKGFRLKQPGPLGFALLHKQLDSMDQDAKQEYIRHLQDKTKSATTGKPSEYVSTLLENLSRMRQGGRPRLERFTGPKQDELTIAHFLVDSLDDVSYQLTKGDKSGVAWYDRDIDALERGVVHLIDHHLDYKSLAKTFGKSDSNGHVTKNPANPMENPRMVLFKALMTPLSFGSNPIVNVNTSLAVLKEAAKIAPHSPFANLPPNNPNPTPGSATQGWSIRGYQAAQAFERINKLVTQLGESGAARWLLTDHPTKEIEGVKPGTSFPYGKKMNYPGSYIFGPKGGPMFLNINRDPRHLTKDLWWSRTWHRIMGTLTTDEGTQDVPKTNQERRVMDEAANRAAAALQLKPHEFQAALWYYEQQLWSALGNRSPSYSYSDGIAEALKRAGLEGVPVPKTRIGPDEDRRQAAISSAIARSHLQG